MSARGRFVVVNSFGVVAVAASIALFWWVGVRGPLGMALSLALTLPTMQLLDDRLAGRPVALWRAAGMGATTGLAGWAMLTLLGS